jgi:hypothetical protein
MRVARWRWVLVPIVVVIGGCLPQPTALDLPASLVSSFGPTPPTFTVLPPPDGTSGQDIVAHLRPNMGEPMFAGRAVPYFVGIDCHRSPQCSTTALGPPGGTETAWLVLYPDCTGPDDGDFGWVLSEGDKWGAGGYTASTPCGP